MWIREVDGINIWFRAANFISLWSTAQTATNIEFPKYTDMRKETIARLGELAPEVRGSQETGSGNLEPTFWTILVQGQDYPMDMMARQTWVAKWGPRVPGFRARPTKSQSHKTWSWHQETWLFTDMSKKVQARTTILRLSSTDKHIWL